MYGVDVIALVAGNLQESYIKEDQQIGNTTTYERMTWQTRHSFGMSRNRVRKSLRNETRR